MHSIESSFKINGQFTDEDISSYFVNPEDTVQDMILVSTDPDFRKACMLAIIDNNRSDVTKGILSHPDFRSELEVLFLENRQSMKFSADKMSEGRLFESEILRYKEQLQMLRSQPNASQDSIKLLESSMDQLIEAQQTLSERFQATQ